jgi:uncharacterized protein YqjF (DUF2071 family)
MKKRKKSNTQEKNPDSHPWWPWMVHQVERHILFLNWAVEPALLEELIPKKFTLDVYEGKAWITLIPFRMTKLRARFLPPIKGTSNFPELDFFTYVVVNGQPGLYFFAVDAPRTLFSRIANLVGLPYKSARISMSERQDLYHFHSERLGKGIPARFSAKYGPSGDPFYAQPGSLHYFLAERFTMFTQIFGAMNFRGDEARAPRELFEADFEIQENTLFDTLSLSLPPQPDLSFFTPIAVDKTWSPYPIFVRSKK